MQEGTLSLMQLAKTVAALERLRAAGVPFVSVLTDPTTGGVFASFAVLGDVNIAEPNALIGFAGARVSAGTIAQELPPGFQRSEFLFEHGFLDRVVHRSALRDELVGLLPLPRRPAGPATADADEQEVIGLPNFRPFSFLSNLAERVLPGEPEPAAGHERQRHGRADDADATSRRRSRRGAAAAAPVARDDAPRLTPIARRPTTPPHGSTSPGRRARRRPHPGRRIRSRTAPDGRSGVAAPTRRPVVDRILGRGRDPRTAPADDAAAPRRARPPDPEGRDLGPRPARPQPAPAADPRPRRRRWPTSSSSSTATGCSATTRPSSPGFARIGERRVVVIGQQKGADTEENIRRNFGMPHPEGYRKAMRVMELAERFGLPIVTFVDVPGAHPGPESEERGIAESIARSIGLMSRLRTPIVVVITGEGGSGGALAIAVGDVVVALENAVYSVISPEGCASILWRTADEARDRRRSRCG